jgi:hypothetical protein
MREHAVFSRCKNPHADAWRFCTVIRAARA